MTATEMLEELARVKAEEEADPPAGQLIAGVILMALTVVAVAWLAGRLLDTVPVP